MLSRASFLVVYDPSAIHQPRKWQKLGVSCKSALVPLPLVAMRREFGSMVIPAECMRERKRETRMPMFFEVIVYVYFSGTLRICAVFARPIFLIARAMFFASRIKSPRSSCLSKLRRFMVFMVCEGFGICLGTAIKEVSGISSLVLRLSMPFFVRVKTEWSSVTLM